jgi:hypothetical protein
MIAQPDQPARTVEKMTRQEEFLWVGFLPF